MRTHRVALIAAAISALILATATAAPAKTSKASTGKAAPTTAQAARYQEEHVDIYEYAYARGDRCSLFGDASDYRYLGDPRSGGCGDWNNVTSSVDNATNRHIALFEGFNGYGASFCLHPGEYVEALGRYGWDNVASSSYEVPSSYCD